jgi:hypothetical protein
MALRLGILALQRLLELPAPLGFDGDRDIDLFTSIPRCRG